MGRRELTIPMPRPYVLKLLQNGLAYVKKYFNNIWERTVNLLRTLTVKTLLPVGFQIDGLWLFLGLIDNEGYFLEGSKNFA